MTSDPSNFGSVLAVTSIDSVPAPGTGAGDQAAAPHFVNAGALDQREAPGSPTIVAGASSGVVAGELDVNGTSRVQDGAPDIGAYQVPGKVTPPPSRRLACGRGDIRCSGLLSLTVTPEGDVRACQGPQAPARRDAHRHVGTALFAISPRHSATVVVALSREAGSLLRRAGRAGLAVAATARGDANVAHGIVRLLR